MGYFLIQFKNLIHLLLTTMMIITQMMMILNTQNQKNNQLSISKVLKKLTLRPV